MVRIKHFRSPLMRTAGTKTLRRILVPHNSGVIRSPKPWVCNLTDMSIFLLDSERLFPQPYIYQASISAHHTHWGK
jgi:hypothetical protein